MKKIIIFLLMSIIILSCSNNNNNTNETKTESNLDVIRVATQGQHPLFSQINSEGKLEGYDIDVWEEIGKRLNKKIEWQQLALEGCFGALDAGKADTIANQISITKTRTEKYNFTEPYFLSPYKFCVAGSNNSINKFEDMFGKKLGLSIGSAAHENIKRLDPEGKIEIVSFSPDTIITLPNNVVNGKIDSYIEAVIIFDDRKAKTGLDLKLTGDTVYTEVNAFPFRKDEKSKKLCDEVSKVIISMRDDGTLEKLAVKWFGYNPMEGLDANAELDKLLQTF